MTLPWLSGLMLKYHLIIALCLLLNSAAVASHSMALQTHAGGTLYVDAVMADQVPVKLLLDTGASMLTVNRQTFQRLRQHTELLYSHDLGFRNANGKIHKVKVYVLPRLTLGSSCKLENVELVVMASGNNILGMNVLSRFAPIGLSIQPPALELSNCDTGLIAGRP